ncbi:DNA-binding response regulator [Anaerobacillus alkaliphilus]|uniref:DNA-binding response regulator n=1 Tax=Anaerobacillus alkaliphilus TaxID=1548597 RepID=A0A4Q0VQI7_9BACI|nr:response regulator transcription factor [Anaerobacillus alkaliphilus]RXI98381.1 DNA-binding response regulator [Anaerobacillus alkaliphilus]
MSQTVLIINPEPLITSKVSDSFREAGFLHCHTSDLEEGLHLIKDLQPVLIILDLDFTRYQAFDFCRTLRMQQQNWTPLILMSERDEEFDLVLGLELGADDYIRKPVRAKELVARVKSILRRQSMVWPDLRQEVSNLPLKDDILVNGDISISPANYSVYVKNILIDLTMKEFEILLYLCQNKGTPISREQLLSVVGDEQILADPRVIDVFISRIREKIEPCRNKPLYIKTVRGIGYMMVEQKVYVL